MMEFSNFREVTARKDHRCSLCDGKIKKGEKYVRFSGKYDGDFFDDCFHKTCNNMISDFCAESGDQEYDQWMIFDWLCEKYCYDCKYGSRNEDDCDKSIFSCEKILKDF